ncbi:MAG: cobalt ECF transporter T component CbiQ [bacterium]
MAKINSALFDIGYMDTLSSRDTFIHRLDPRIKLVTTLIFIVMVVSFDKYQISGLVPFLLYLVVVIALADLPIGYLLKKIIIVSPFALMIGIFNPLLDTNILMNLGPLRISGGWISFASIMVRFILTVGAALVLISSTGFIEVCMAAEKIGVPRIFAIQLLFIYRYLFVLIDEASRMVMARALRSFNKKGMGLRVFGSLVGHLLLRTLDRAQRIHHAMLCRGFNGEIRIIRKLNIGLPEVLFFLCSSSFFIVMRLYNIPQLMGNFFMEFMI